MIFEGIFTWVMLTVGGVPMAALLGLVTGVLAFIPNIGAITSGVLMVAVGFSAGAHQGVYAIFVYFFVQNIDGYLVVPYIARRTVDLAPAVVLAMQLLMGALFGILGILFADPILATHESGARRPQPPSGGGGGRNARDRRRPDGLLRRVGRSPRLLHHRRAAADDLAHLHLEGEVAGLGEALRRRTVPEGQARRHGEAVDGRLPASWSSPRRSRGRPVHGERLRAAVVLAGVERPGRRPTVRT